MTPNYYEHIKGEGTAESCYVTAYHGVNYSPHQRRPDCPDVNGSGQTESPAQSEVTDKADYPKDSASEPPLSFTAPERPENAPAVSISLMEQLRIISEVGDHWDCDDEIERDRLREAHAAIREWVRGEIIGEDEYRHSNRDGLHGEYNAGVKLRNALRAEQRAALQHPEDEG